MLEEKKVRKAGSEHNMIMEGREKASVSGVLDVETFDENNIVLITQLGALSIKGDGLHINKLNVDSGELVVEGQIDAFFYSESSLKEKEGFWAKIFK